jgi:hypothetical protein
MIVVLVVVATSPAPISGAEVDRTSVVVGPFYIVKGKGLLQLHASGARQSSDGEVIVDTILSDRVVADGLTRGKVRIEPSDTISVRGRRQVRLRRFVIDFSKGRVTGVFAGHHMTIFRFRNTTIRLPAGNSRIRSRSIALTFMSQTRSVLRRTVERKRAISANAGMMTVLIGEYGPQPG